MHSRKGVAALAIAIVLGGCAALSSNAAPAGAIVGGGTADASTVPWAVALLRHAQSDPLYAQFCGGTLIASSWVLTAARCVDTMTPSGIDVVSGVTFLTDIQPSDRRTIDRIVVQPRYDAYRDLSDVALLHLAAPATGVPTMPINRSAAAPVVDDTLHTYGWGNMSMDSDAYANDLQTVAVADLAGPTGACGSYTSAQYFSEHMLCAGAADGNGGEDACQGDTGGPLVSTGPNPVLVGVTSARLTCGQAATPGIYARVSSYAAWIDDVMNPAAPKLSVGDVNVPEGDRGDKLAYFRVTMSKRAATTVTVHWTTANYTAIAPSDYTAAAGVVTLAPGQVGAWIPIVVHGDTGREATELFLVRLSGATGGAHITRAQGVGRILDDDVRTSPYVMIGDAYTVEGNDGVQYACATVVLSRPVSTPVMMFYGTVDGTARAGFDYTAASGSLTFAPGTVAKYVTIPVQSDWLHEGGANETFTIHLANVVGPVHVAHSISTVTILNDD